MKPKPYQPSGTAPPSLAPIADPEVQRQLARLFGESLFGAWPELAASAPMLRHRRRSFARIWGLLGALLLVAAAWGLHALLQPGLTRQVADHRANYAQQLQTFINDGDFERAAQFLPLVVANSRVSVSGSAEAPDQGNLEPNDEHLDLIVGTQAALYRYFDADPGRLRSIHRFLEDSGQASPTRLIASFTVLSRQERAARLAELERLRNDLPNNNQLEYLLASAFSYRNDVKAARQAWENSANLGPAWLCHRFEQAYFELHQANQPAAQKLASQIVRVDPDSAWAKLSITTFELPRDAATQSVRGDAAAPVVAPVEIFFEKLQQSSQAMRRDNPGLAQQSLVAASAAIHHQAPFLFDAFDWLLADKQFELARMLTRLPEWPNEDKIAAAKLERLSATAARQTDAAPVASPIVRPGGLRAKRKANRRASK
jgi:hypothetical protein